MQDGPRILVAAALGKIIEPLLRQSLIDAKVRIAEDKTAVQQAINDRLRFDWQEWSTLPGSCIVVAARNPSPLVRVQDLAAIALVLISVTGEALADDQMRRFRRSSGHGRNICDAGLWQWSRHPNYFFEWLFWLALPLLAVGSGYAVGWVAILAPLCMYWLLVHVSGIPPLEAHLARSRGTAFAEYCRRTSAFLPLPPRRAG